MIAIPNMEKPKSCEDCQFLSLDGVVTDDNEWVSYEICEVAEQLIKEDITCPLINIVTCGECKHYDFGLCSKLHLITSPENFCSDGERK